MNDYELTIQKLEEEHRFALSRISHEIRNPVTMINSSLQIIEQEHPEVLNFAFWKDVKEDLTYLRNLLDELSSYNNSDTLSLSAIRTKEWLESLIPKISLLIGRQQVEFHFSIADDLPVIQADPVKLRQVLINLVRNSLEAGCSSLQLFASVEENNLKISVSDNGCGIPSEYTDTLFRPFVTHKSGGSGLGLALSRNIMEAHGGQLLLSSSNKSGTCFTALLPINMAASKNPRTNPPT
ncbi:MAG: HAMP domain-containing sensor histidine kinase [Candidatus Limivivens sp.]|nr:HAMP domain-containing sensor histidine kinase [Candidatus Limivivens sp.]